MAYENLKTAIKQAIKQNGNQEITGNLLQSTLLNIVNTLGADYRFLGFASPSTVPPDSEEGRLFYFASEAGEYPNFKRSDENEYVNIGPGVSVITKEANSDFWKADDLINIAQELGTAKDMAVSQNLLSLNFTKNVYYLACTKTGQKNPTFVLDFKNGLSYLKVDVLYSDFYICRAFVQKFDADAQNACIRVELSVEQTKFDLTNPNDIRYLALSKNSENKYFLKVYKYTETISKDDFIVGIGTINSGFICFNNVIIDDIEYSVLTPISSFVDKNKIAQELGTAKDMVVSQNLLSLNFTKNVYYLACTKSEQKNPTFILDFKNGLSYLKVDALYSDFYICRAFVQKFDADAQNAYIRVELSVERTKFDLTSPNAIRYLALSKNSENKYFLKVYKYIETISKDDFIVGIGTIYSGFVCFNNVIIDDIEYSVLTPTTPENNIEKFRNVSLAILGDSISTFKGWLPSDLQGYDGSKYEYYYPSGNVDTVDKCWWHIVASKLGISLSNVSNCAWSGSTVTGTHNSDNNAYAGCSNRRISDLALRINKSPDIIICFISCNDWGSNVQIGDYSTENKPVNSSTFREAYALMLYKIKKAYPKARVFCCTNLDDKRRDAVNDFPSNNASGISTYKWNTNIEEIAKAFGCEIIDLHSCGISLFNISDFAVDTGLHLNTAGHKLMASKVIKELIQKF